MVLSSWEYKSMFRICLIKSLNSSNNVKAIFKTRILKKSYNEAFEGQRF